LNPALLRAFRSFRHDRVGGFLDSYFHQLFFAFKLVYFFQKSLQVAFYGFSDVFEGFFAGFSLAYASWQFDNLG